MPPPIVSGGNSLGTLCQEKMIILSDDAESSSFPVVNWLLILFNVSLFCYALCPGGKFLAHGVVPLDFVHYHDLAQFDFILTAMFAHAGFAHLFGNMWALYLFGDNVEDKLGHVTYLAFYIACGLFADLLHIFVNPGSTLPCVGASGAIAGVMGSYILLHPNASCKTWWGGDLIFFAFKTYKIPAVLVIGFWFLAQLALSSFVPLTAGGIAFHAHIGGFIAGMVLTMILVRGSSRESTPQESKATLEFYSNPRVFWIMGLGLIAIVGVMSQGLGHANPPQTVQIVSRQSDHPQPAKKPAKPVTHSTKIRTAHVQPKNKNNI
jgi:membrane associated rhomboid family serine protease